VLNCGSPDAPNKPWRSHGRALGQVGGSGISHYNVIKLGPKRKLISNLVPGQVDLSFITPIFQVDSAIQRSKFFIGGADDVTGYGMPKRSDDPRYIK